MEKDMAKQASFEQTLITSDTFRVVPVSRQILKEAALLRVTYTSLRLPDAIHVATGSLSGCSVFLTNDSRIKAVPAMQVLLLKDFVPA